MTRFQMLGARVGVVLTRLRHAWAVLTGAVSLPRTLEEYRLMTSLTQTAAAIDALNTAAGALIAKAQSDAAALATAQADIANADADTAQKVAVVTQAINAVLPQSSVAVDQVTGDPALTDPAAAPTA
ncbi:hypothetical protein [Novosphingobium nitrogenifigens]|nr:hypothetical protein [Novosphingobium nitrogenifigens]